MAISADSEIPPNSILNLTATVYPGPLTLLSWTHDLDDGTSRNFSGWSNIDFNHLKGISTIPASDDEQLSYMMAIGTEQLAPETAPDFATEAPTFIPNGAIPAEALIAIDALHEYYAVEGANLAAAHAEREQALLAAEEETETETLQDTESENQEEAEYEAEEEEAPPPPLDLIIRYRIAETPLLAAPAEGGAQ